MWPQIGNEDEPDWVQTEREHFDKWRDLNQVCVNSLILLTVYIYMAYIINMAS